MSDRLRKYRVAVFVSGGGSNLQSLIDASARGDLNSRIELVLSNNPNAFGLERAKQSGIDTFVSVDEDKILSCLEKYQIDRIVLAGYLKVIGNKILDRYSNRIINIHPSLLPKFGGKGMYGIHVHEAVFAAGEKVSGATVHFVTPLVDGGEILIQEQTDISNCGSPKEIQEKVLELEHKIIVEAVKILEEI